MKRIVLSGFFGYDNAGDEAILLSLIQTLKQNEYEPVVLSANPEKTTSLYNVESVHRMQPMAVFKALKSSDGLISGGGSLLQDATSAQSSLYYLGVMKMARMLRKPVFAYAQGIGPLNRGWLRKLVGSQMNNITYCSVRDEASKTLLEDCGVRCSIDVTVDPVLNVETSQVTLDKNISDMLDKGAAVFCLRSWEENEEMTNYYREVISSLNKKEIPVLLLPFHYPEDVLFSEKVANGFAPEQTRVLNEAMSLDEMFAIIQRSKLVFGVRLHALIFAASVETPFIGLSYDPKIEAFLSLYDYKAIASTSSFDANETLDGILKIWQSPNSEKIHIKNRNKVLSERISLPIEALNDYFASKG